MSYFSISSPTMSLTYTFAPNTLIRSAQINTNLSTDIVGKSNTNIQSIIDNLAARNLPLGFCENLGVSYSSGTFKLVQSNGSDLTTSDGAYGYVSCPSTTAGKIIPLKVSAATHLFQDAAHATDSDIIGEEFGVTSGVAWGEDRPFFLYAVNADDTSTNLKFAISPNPCATTSPATTNIGYADTPAATPSDTNFFFLTTTNVTVTHAQKPCVCIGAFRMRMNSSDDWTVQALSNADGIGRFHESTNFTMPSGQMGATSGKYLADNGGAAAVFTTNQPYYKIDKSGVIDVNIYLSGDGGTDGAGAVDAKLSLPYREASGATNVYVGTGVLTNATSSFPILFNSGNGIPYAYMIYASTLTALGTVKNSDFPNGSRGISGVITLKAF